MQHTGLGRVTLRDGTPATIRPFHHEIGYDEVRAHYAMLSPESKFHRFLAGVPDLTPALLHHLVDDVDGIDHVALILDAPEPDGNIEHVGVARAIRYQDDPTAMDVAVTVLDQWHGRGVASRLLRALVAHRPAGVDHIVTEVAADNRPALAMLERLGPTTTTQAHGSPTLSVRVELAEPSSRPSTVARPSSAAAALH